MSKERPYKDAQEYNKYSGKRYSDTFSLYIEKYGFTIISKAKNTKVEMNVSWQQFLDLKNEIEELEEFKRFRREQVMDEV